MLQMLQLRPSPAEYRATLECQSSRRLRGGDVSDLIAYRFGWARPPLTDGELAALLFERSLRREPVVCFMPLLMVTSSAPAGCADTRPTCDAGHGFGTAFPSMLPAPGARRSRHASGREPLLDFIGHAPPTRRRDRHVAVTQIDPFISSRSVCSRTRRSSPCLANATPITRPLETALPVFRPRASGWTIANTQSRWCSCVESSCNWSVTSSSYSVSGSDCSVIGLRSRRDGSRLLVHS